MRPMQVRPRVSYQDLETWPEDGRRYELYDGEVVVIPSPLPVHQFVADNIGRLLFDYAKVHGGFALTSPIDIIFSDYDVLQPDVIFFTAARRHLVNLRAPIRHRPDLAVEVLSPSTTARDRGAKLRTFARFGVPEYWIVDPDAKCVEVLTAGEQGFTARRVMQPADRLESPLLTNLRIQVADLFPSEE